jgi:hypothetical protein
MKTSHFELPNIGDEYDYNGIPCYVIDVCNEGAWFGLAKGIKRIDRHKGAFREFGSADYPKKK